MSGINFGEIKVTSTHKQDGVWWGDAAEIDDVTIDQRAETATKVGVLLAGKKAVGIVQRGYSFADPIRDEPDLNLDHFVEERVVDGVILRPQGIHPFRNDVSYGVGLFAPDVEQPFGLVVPGMGSIIHTDRMSEFRRVAIDAHLRGPEVDAPITDLIASKAIGICGEYVKLKEPASLQV